MRNRKRIHRWNRWLALLTLMMAVLAGCGRSGFDDEFVTDNPETGLPDVRPEVSNDVSDTPPSEIGPDVNRTLVSLVIEPAAVTLPVNSKTQLRARALYSDNSLEDVTAGAAWTSDTATIASVDSTGSVSAVSAGTVRVRASFLGLSAQAIVTVPGNPIIDLVIEPASGQSNVGGTFKFTAIATFQGGTKTDVSPSAAWSVDNSAIAKVELGLATGISQGTAKIIATLGGRTATAAFDVRQRTLTKIDVSPFGTAIGVGVVINYKATGIYSDGSTADITSSATWTSEAPAVVSIVSTGTNAGRATAVGAGSSTITATFETVKGSAPVSVTDSPLLAILVSPKSVTLAQAGTIQVTATAQYANGTFADVTQTGVWASASSDIAVVAQGKITGIKVGDTTVTITFGGKTATVNVSVSPAKLLLITLSPADPTLTMGVPGQVKATGTYEGGGTRDITADVSWSTDDKAIATVATGTTDAGKITPVAIGSTTVRATLDGVSASGKLTVSPATLTSISVEPASYSLAQGLKKNVTATATYSDNTSKDITATCVWSSSAEGVAKVSNGPGAQGEVTAVGAGAADIICSFDGKNGNVKVHCYRSDCAISGGGSNNGSMQRRSKRYVYRHRNHV